MRYTGIQPQYFPRLHYIARILTTDIFVIRDDVQFVRAHKYPDGKIGKSYQAHTPIKHLSGLRLMPVSITHEGITALYDTHIEYSLNWVEGHLKSIQEGYFKAKYFEQIFPQITKLLQHKYPNLAELNIVTLMWGLSHILGNPSMDIDKLNLDYINNFISKQKKFRIKKILKATDTETYKKFDKMSANEKIVALCKEVGATEDYSGGTANVAYIDHLLFAKNKIKVTIQDWKCQEYPQQYVKQFGFIPNLSIIDLLMNVTNKEAAEIINE